MFLLKQCKQTVKTLILYELGNLHFFLKSSKKQEKEAGTNFFIASVKIYD